MRILIVGAGALGGFFGARLLAAGRDVTFLVRPHTASLLAAHGLQLLSPFGDLSLGPPATVLAEHLREPFDLILLSCKAYDLTGAMDSFAPAVGPSTAILPLLNGMAHLDLLDRRFGREHVLGGATTVSAARDSDGRIHHLNRLDALLFGDRDDPSGPRIQRIAEALTVPGHDAQLRPAILQDMAQKWTAIATAAGMTSLMRASIGDIVSAGAAPLVHQLLVECTSITSAEDFPPSPAYLDTTIAKFTQPGSPFTASMLRDLEAGRPVEARQIIGDLLDRGRRHSLATPLLEVVHLHLRCYEERRARENRATSAPSPQSAEVPR